MIRTLSQRRSAETARILRLRDRLERQGYVVTHIGPDGVTVAGLTSFDAGGAP